MSVIIVAFGVILLLVLMMKFKLNGFISLLLVSLVVGILEGMPLNEVVTSMENGIGGQVKSLILILGFGAMLGKILAECGAAQRIANTMVSKFGIKRIQWAMIVTALIIGITMFFEAGFIILIPIIFTIAAETGLSLLYVAYPAVVGLSVTHSFLPPHPGPSAVCILYGASIGKTLLLGLPIAIPGAIIVGIFFARTKFISKIKGSIPEGLNNKKIFTEEEMPSFITSLIIAVIPIILMAFNAFAEMFLPTNSPILYYTSFIGDAPIALFISSMIAIYVLGIKRGKTIDEMMNIAKESTKSIAMILFVIAAGGAFKQVIVDAGVGDYIKNMLDGVNISPLILAWGIAAILRVALGSATVAVTTAAGIALPFVTGGEVSPELMVLATTCGSIFASHVNDPGFWMYKEYLNLSVGEALKTRTSYTTILSFIGLIGVLILDIFI